MITARRSGPFTLLGLAAGITLAPAAILAQAPMAHDDAKPATHYVPGAAFDASSIDTAADPCQDFYKFACGKFAANHPIPADQSGVDQFYVLYNVNNQELSGILDKFKEPSPSRTAREQQIGDYYAACHNTKLLDEKGLAPIQPLLTEIDRSGKTGLAYLTGELQRIGVNAFFGFGQQQDFKDATKQVATFDQGGLGLPERDYYTRTGDKDKQIRDQYVDHVAKMLVLAGVSPTQAATDAKNILAFETRLAQASMTNTERRDPIAVYHPQTLAEFESSVAPMNVKPFFEAIHAPSALPGPLGPNSIINANPKFFPAAIAAVMQADNETLHAYLKYQVLTTFAGQLPHAIDAENFHF